jgi:hypothetical protein
MKRLITLAAAALALAACQDVTAPEADLSTRNAKPVDPPVEVVGNLTNDTFNFNDGTYSSSAGSAFTAEALIGGFGAAAPNISPVHNDSANLFIGRADNHRITLIVPNGGSTYDISYDLYIIGSWDGNGKQSGKEFGVDLWQADIACSATGPAVVELLETTFSNQKTVQQSYPSWYLSNGAGKPAGTGAYATDALGYIHDETAHTPLFRSMGDTWYKMHFTGENPCGAGNPMYFVWTVPLADLQSNYDESWGLDNVVIKTDP